MLPIGNTCNVAMLHRIEMNIIDMPLEVGLIADRVLPIAALPYSFLSFENFTR